MVIVVGQNADTDKWEVTVYQIDYDTKLGNTVVCDSLEEASNVVDLLTCSSVSETIKLKVDKVS